MRAFIAIVVLGVLAGGGWYGYQRVNAPPAVTYETAEVKKGLLVVKVSATGTVEPLVKVLVGTQVSGTIMKWFADFNDPVKEGFVLARLDQDRYNAALEQRQAAVAVAKAKVEEMQAQLSLATMEREHTEQAHKRNAATDLELRNARATEEAARATFHGAKAQLLAAQADERQAAVELDKTIIRCPIDGVVISRDVDEGQTVAATMSAPTLFTIANDLTKMRVNAAVSETDIGKVHDGMPATFRVDAYPDREFEGIVSQVRYAETIENNVVTYTTLIDVDNPDLVLRPGMTARILFEADRVEDALKVPNGALRYSPRSVREQATGNLATSQPPSQPTVYKLVGGRPVKAFVTLGLTDGKFTAVASNDLKPGDVVITGDTSSSRRRNQR
jgi:HlyD family secretion protein